MMNAAHRDDSVRRRIESLAVSLSLPTVRKALGILEGEHRSQQRGGVDDVLDIHAYEAGDEARRIDWKISARSGRPMVVQRERQASSTVHILLDGGAHMQATCVSGERAIDVAANACDMLAALSLRRSDDISLVIGNERKITRMPFHGGFAQFERSLDTAIAHHDWQTKGNMQALLEYALRIRDRHALIVAVTCEQTLTSAHLPLIHRIAQSHPFILIDVGTINPFLEHPVQGRGRVAVMDGNSSRRVPAFFINEKAASQVAHHREFMVSQLRKECSSVGSVFIHADSSESMFHECIRMISRGTVFTHSAMPTRAHKVGE